MNEGREEGRDDPDGRAEPRTGGPTGPSRGASLRRVGVVLGVYAAAAWVVVRGAEWFRRALALPELFESLLHGGLLLGIPLAALLAWKYPDLGNYGHPPGSDGAGK